MSFTFPALAVAGAALAVAPIVIHLINLRRRRRVAWGAMDFLLASHRKNRTRILLSEWLLLALRVLAVAAAGAFAATPQAADLLSGFFGAEPALHAVLLDDTASMRRSSAGQSAWEEAIDAVGRLSANAAEAGDRVIVLRTSDPLTGAAPQDLADEAVEPAGWSPTYASGKLSEGLTRLAGVLRDAEGGGRRYAYVVSDYADTACGESAELAESLQSLGAESTGVVLAACGEATTPNLAIETLALTPGPVAAGVEARIRLAVENHSDQSVAETTVTLRRDGQPLATLRVGPFDPRQRLTVESPVVFSAAGTHVLEAELPGDRMPADDRRWLGVDVARSREVLLVDTSTRGAESRVLAAAMRPAGKTRSGWAPRRVTTLSPDSLSSAAAVVLADVDRLSAASVRLLREYVRAGGGLWVTLGPRLDPDWYNRAMADLSPCRFGPPTTAPAEGALRVADHPAVRVLAGEQNPLVPLVRVSVVRRLADGFAAGEPLIRFTDRTPLMLRGGSGEGRVLALLTSPARGETGALTPWSNLATLPVFPVLVNDAVGWLAHPRLRPRSEAIGVERVSSSGEPNALWRWSVSDGREVGRGFAPASPWLPAEPGVYWRESRGDSGEVFAAVLDPTESDLRAASVDQLRARTGDLARVARASELFRDTPSPESRVPLYVAAATLLAVLVVERLLALGGSYVGVAAPQPRGTA